MRKKSKWTALLRCYALGRMTQALSVVLVTAHLGQMTAIWIILGAAFVGCYPTVKGWLEK